MDKNPDQNNELEFRKFKDVLEKKPINFVLSKDPFLKTFFVTKLVDMIEYPIIYLDFDLMYSGYILAGMVSKKENIFIHQVSKENWEDVFCSILKKISEEKCLIVIDSLNGFSNFFEGRDSGRVVNSYLMLLGSFVNQGNSILLAMSISKKKESEWVLSPTGRHIIETNQVAKFYLRKNESSFFLDTINES